MIWKKRMPNKETQMESRIRENRTYGLVDGANSFQRAGFTLIELLVVVSIITLLITILLPALSAARNAAKDIQCKSQLRQMGIAEFAYANDHYGYFTKAWIRSPSNTVDGNPYITPWGTEGYHDYWDHFWMKQLLPYVGLKSQFDNANGNQEKLDIVFTGIFRCPANPGPKPHWGSSFGSETSYGQNTFRPMTKPRRITSFTKPTRTLLISDATAPRLSNQTVNSSTWAGPNNGYTAFWHSNKTNNILCVDGHVTAAKVDGLSETEKPSGGINQLGYLKHP